jgi:putative DNA primase/helicase
VLGITHLTKGTAGKDPTERVTGSLAFGAVARIVMLAARKQADEDGGPPRIFTRSKSNIGPSGGGFGYDIVASPLYDRPDIIATRIAWHDALEGTAKELLAAAEADDSHANEGSKKVQVERFLKSVLAGGERPQKEIEAQAKLEGISWGTLRAAGNGLLVKRNDWSHPWLSAGRGRGFVRELARHVRGVIAEPGARGSALSSRKRESSNASHSSSASDCHVQVS